MKKNSKRSSVHRAAVSKLQPQAVGSRLLLTETEIISDEYIRNNKKIKITKLKFQQPWLLKYH